MTRTADPHPRPDLPQLVTVAAVAAQLSVSDDLVRDLIDRGELVASRGPPPGRQGAPVAEDHDERQRPAAERQRREAVGASGEREARGAKGSSEGDHARGIRPCQQRLPRVVYAGARRGFGAVQSTAVFLREVEKVIKGSCAQGTQRAYSHSTQRTERSERDRRAAMSTKITKSVEISTWGYKGSVATIERDVSDADVRVRQDGEDTAQRAYGRRVSRVAGRGLQLINSQLSHVEREGNVQAAVYELTFGYAVRGGGCEVAGSCWIKVYG